MKKKTTKLKVQEAMNTPELKKTYGKSQPMLMSLCTIGTLSSNIDRQNFDQSCYTAQIMVFRPKYCKWKKLKLLLLPYILLKIEFIWATVI